MDVPKLLEQAWERALRSELTLRGWSAFEMKDVVAYEKLVGECRQRLVADVLRQPRGLLVLPKVGVSFPEIDQFLDGFESDRNTSSATVGIDLIHLVRRVHGEAGPRRWAVSEEESVDDLAVRVYDDLEKFGELLFRDFMSMEMLMKNYREYSLTPPQRLDVAVAFFAQGQVEAARAMVDQIASDESLVDPRIREKVERVEERLRLCGG